MDLRSYLTAAHSSVETFAEHIGVVPSTVYRWINGTVKPDSNAAVAIERATDGRVPVETWATVEALATRPQTVAVPVADPAPDDSA